MRPKTIVPSTEGCSRAGPERTHGNAGCRPASPVRRFAACCAFDCATTARHTALPALVVVLGAQLARHSSRGRCDRASDLAHASTWAFSSACLTLSEGEVATHGLLEAQGRHPISAAKPSAPEGPDTHTPADARPQPHPWRSVARTHAYTAHNGSDRSSQRIGGRFPCPWPPAATPRPAPAGSASALAPPHGSVMEGVRRPVEHACCRCWCSLQRTGGSFPAR